MSKRNNVSLYIYIYIYDNQIIQFINKNINNITIAEHL